MEVGSWHKQEQGAAVQPKGCSWGLLAPLPVQDYSELDAIFLVSGAKRLYPVGCAHSSFPMAARGNEVMMVGTSVTMAAA